ATAARPVERARRLLRRAAVAVTARLELHLGRLARREVHRRPHRDPARLPGVPVGRVTAPDPAAAPHALVTGGLRGIGLATCRALLAAGFDVTGVSRSASDAAAACSEVADARFQAVPLDVRDEPAVAELI